MGKKGKDRPVTPQEEEEQRPPLGSISVIGLHQVLSKYEEEQNDENKAAITPAVLKFLQIAQDEEAEVALFDTGLWSQIMSRISNVEGLERIEMLACMTKIITWPGKIGVLVSEDLETFDYLWALFDDMTSYDPSSQEGGGDKEDKQDPAPATDHSPSASLPEAEDPRCVELILRAIKGILHHNGHGARQRINCKDRKILRQLVALTLNHTEESPTKTKIQIHTFDIISLLCPREHLAWALTQSGLVTSLIVILDLAFPVKPELTEEEAAAAAAAEKKKKGSGGKGKGENSEESGPRPCDRDLLAAALSCLERVCYLSRPGRMLFLREGVPMRLCSIASKLYTRLSEEGGEDKVWSDLAEDERMEREALLTCCLEALASSCEQSITAAWDIFIHGGLKMMRMMLPSVPEREEEEEAAEGGGSSTTASNAAAESKKGGSKKGGGGEEEEEDAAAEEEEDYEGIEVLPCPSEPMSSPSVWIAALRVMSAILRHNEVRDVVFALGYARGVYDDADFFVQDDEIEEQELKVPEESKLELEEIMSKASPAILRAADSGVDQSGPLIKHLSYLIRQAEDEPEPEPQPEPVEPVQKEATKKKGGGKNNDPPAKTPEEEAAELAALEASKILPFPGTVQLAAAACLQSMALNKYALVWIARSRHFRETFGKLSQIPHLLVASKVTSLVATIGSQISPKILDENLDVSATVMGLAKKTADTNLSVLKSAIGRTIMAHRPEYPTRPPLPSPPPSPPAAPSHLSGSVWDTLADMHLASGVAQHS